MKLSDWMKNVTWQFLSEQIPRVLNSNVNGKNTISFFEGLARPNFWKRKKLIFKKEFKSRKKLKSGEKDLNHFFRFFPFTTFINSNAEFLLRAIKKSFWFLSCHSLSLSLFCSCSRVVSFPSCHHRPPALPSFYNTKVIFLGPLGTFRPHPILIILSTFSSLHSLHLLLSHPLLSICQSHTTLFSLSLSFTSTQDHQVVDLTLTHFHSWSWKLSNFPRKA